MNDKQKLLLVGMFFCLALIGCARDRKYYREETGVLKTKSRAADGVNTGELK